MVFSAAAHGRPDLVQDDLPLQQVRDLAMLSHQHKGIRLIAPWVDQWATELFPEDQCPEDEPEKYNNEMEKIWIAYEFGFEKQFLQTCFELAFVSTVIIPSRMCLPPGLHGKLSFSPMQLVCAKLPKRRYTHADLRMLWKL